MNQLNIIAAQVNLLLGDIEGNAERIIREAKHAATHHQGDIIAFPELALCGYPPEDLLFRNGLYLRCHQALNKICEQTADLDLALIVGYPEQIDAKIYNQIAVIIQGKVIAHYAKQKLPNYAVFDEKRYFHAGNSPCVINIKDIPIGILICEDVWFPEPAQQAVAAGAKLLISVNASPFDRSQALARETVLIERTHEVHVPLIYVNLVGGQDELVFDGGSMVINAQGQRCQQAAYFQEQLMLIKAKCNHQQQIEIESHALPQRLTEEESIYQALVLGVRDYIQKNHFPSAILGLSGGIDSALTLTIAVDAIGADKITTVMMPSSFTRTISIEDAYEQAQLLAVKHLLIPIDPIFQTILTSLSDPFAGLARDSTEENIQARIRGTLLMALSNKTGAIVLSTGNKSEMAVGYSTLYGDMVGGFAPLKDIPKTMVYRLANYRNSIGNAIPPRVIEREPSAELAEDQLDQDTLPPYPILDQILYLYIEMDQSPQLIYETGLDKVTVDRVIKMVNRNEYKRRQAPIGIRTTKRAFGKDRRYPITSGYTKYL